MYARTLQRPKQRKAQTKTFPAPVGGWISNRALATPQAGAAPGAAILDNFFPRATGVVLRRGSRRYATLGDGTKDALSLFSYNTGAVRKLFGATEEALFEVTSIEFAYNSVIVDANEDRLVTEDGDFFGWSSTGNGLMQGFTGGDWIVVQFATTGGIYLVGVNGRDDGFIYDGTDFWHNVAGGFWSVAYDSEVTPFTEGSVLTGGTSGAVAMIHRVDEDRLILRDIVGGPFEDDEIITDDEGGEASVDGDQSSVVPGVEFADGLTSADMSFVWVYKNRLWFAQKESLNAWYMADVDAIGGEATVFPLAGVLGKGGALLFGQSWSLEAGAEGGLSEQCIFASDEGEVAIFQGGDPNEAADWGKVGVYRIGKPLGTRAFIRGGGDLAISTSVGLVPLSKAIQLDVTSLNTATVSYGIADAWTEATGLRGMEGWQAELWPEQKMAIISPPITQDAPAPVLFVSNTETGAWGRYTGWDARCMEVFGGRLFMGGADGRVVIANVGGDDEGQAYTGTVLPLYDDFGAPASLKIPTTGRSVVRGTSRIAGQVSFMAEYTLTLPSAPSAASISSIGSIWGAGIWGTSVWGGGLADIVSQDWSSLGGRGVACSLAYQVTSGSVQPLDVEVIRMDMLYTTAEAMT